MNPNDEKRKLLQTYSKDLSCKLHAEEVADHAQRLACIEEDLAIHHERAKSIKAELSAKEAALESERTTIARKVRTKEETRPVKVNIWADFDLGKAVFERSDTSEVLEARALTDKERQTAMFRDEHKDDEKSAKELAEELFANAHHEQAEVKPKPTNVVDSVPEKEGKKPKKMLVVDPKPPDEKAPDEEKAP